jgi:anti-sigma B factor antagonist
MHPSDDFTVEVHRRPGAAIVSPAGEIDVATVDQVRERLRECEADAEAVVLDLRRVEFMDTSGLQLVFETQQRASGSGFEFIVVRGSAALQRLFEIAGFGDRLRLVNDPDDAA